MDAIRKNLFTSQAVKALLLCVVGVILFLTEQCWLGRDVAIRQVPIIVGAATLFFAFGLLCSFLYLRIMQRGGKWAMNYYLLHTMIRLFIVVVLIVLYALLVHADLLAFSLNVFIIYLTEMICSTVTSVKIEHLMQHTK